MLPIVLYLIIPYLTKSEYVYQIQLQAVDGSPIMWKDESPEMQLAWGELKQITVINGDVISFSFNQPLNDSVTLSLIGTNAYKVDRNRRLLIENQPNLVLVQELSIDQEQPNDSITQTPDRTEGNSPKAINSGEPSLPPKDPKRKQMALLKIKCLNAYSAIINGESAFLESGTTDHFLYIKVSKGKIKVSVLDKYDEKILDNYPINVTMDTMRLSGCADQPVLSGE